MMYMEIRPRFYVKAENDNHHILKNRSKTKDIKKTSTGFIHSII